MYTENTELFLREIIILLRMEINLTQSATGNKPYIAENIYICSFFAQTKRSNIKKKDIFEDVKNHAFSVNSCTIYR